MAARCFICGEDNPNVLHEHHAVPRRFGGGDDIENVYVLCANCHEAVEKIYDKSFYERLPGFDIEEQRVALDDQPDVRLIEDGESIALSDLMEQFIQLHVEIEQGWRLREDFRKAFVVYADRNGVEVEEDRALATQFGKKMNELLGDSFTSGMRKKGTTYEGVDLSSEALKMLKKKENG